MSLECDLNPAKAKVSIVPATTQHINSIYNITRDAFNQYVKDANIPGTPDALKETLDDIAKDINEKKVFVALVNDIPAGSIRLTVKPDSTAYISRFGVLLGYQSLGIGRSLIKESIEFLKSNNLNSVSLHTAANSGLVGFYSHFGFTTEEITHEKGYPRALMVLKLG